MDNKNKDLYKKLADKLLNKSGAGEDDELKPVKETDVDLLKKKDEDSLADAFKEEDEEKVEKVDDKKEIDIEDDLKDVEEELEKDEGAVEDEKPAEDSDEEEEVEKIKKEVAKQETDPNDEPAKKEKEDDEAVLDKEEEKLLDDMLSGNSSGSLTGVKPDVFAGNLPPEQDRYRGWTKVVNNVMESMKHSMSKLAKQAVKERRAARFWKKMFIEERKKNIYNQLTKSSGYELSDREKKRISRILDKCNHVHSLNKAADMIAKVIVENKERMKQEVLKEYKDTIKNVKRFIE